MLEIIGKLWTIHSNLIVTVLCWLCSDISLYHHTYINVMVNNCCCNHCKLIIIIENHLILPDYAQSIRRRGRSISIKYLFMLRHVQHCTNEYYVKTSASLKPSLDKSVFNYCITTNPEEGEEEFRCVTSVSHTRLPSFPSRFQG